MQVDIDMLRGLAPAELIDWAEKNCNIYLDVNAEPTALLGQLLRYGIWSGGASQK